MFRSDYMLDVPSSGSQEHPSIKQVEFNTISSSFGALSSKVTDLHRFLVQSQTYPDESAPALNDLPENKAIDGLVHGLAEAHKAYGSTECVSVFSCSACLLI